MSEYRESDASARTGLLRSTGGTTPWSQTTYLLSRDKRDSRHTGVAAVRRYRRGVPTLERHRTLAHDPRPAREKPTPRRGGLSPATLAIASAASVAAAYVVSRVWGPGTVYGAAATPVIVALVSELLHRPARAIESVRRTRDTIAFDPVAEGRAGLREGALDAIADGSGDRHLHQAPAARQPRRRTVVAALVTGVLAFGVGALVLTGGELALGGSSVSGHARTTFFGGKAHTSSSSSRTRDETTTTTTTDGQGARPAPTTTGQQPQPTTPQGTGTDGTTTTPPSGGTGAPPDTAGTSTTPPPAATPAPPDQSTTPTTPAP